jgi:hypothetical protein
MTDGLPEPAAPHAPRWPRRLLAVGLLLAMASLVYMAAHEQSAKSVALLAAVPASGLYTAALYATRRLWLPRLARRPVRNAVLLGVFNAAAVETLFLVMEKVTGAQHVAANPNLLVDLLITMPWYVPMVWTFVRVQQRQRFAATVVLILAGLYETGADGIFAGAVLPLVSGAPFNPAHFLLLPIMFFGFIPVYSSMILAPAWVLDAGREAACSDPLPWPPAWRDALKPLFWLLPYAAIAVPLMMVAARQKP